jgi:NAD(P)H-dependent FMN reductase
MPRLLVTCGSARSASWNKRLAHAAEAMARAAGAQTTFVDPATLRLPLYDGDEEAAEGLPENARAWKDHLAAHDGLVLACPEYNGSITPLLKNVIDWASRREGDEAPLRAFRGKTALLLSTSPGALGGLRGLVHVRAILSGIGVHVVPDQLAVPHAPQALREDGSLVDPTLGTRLREMIVRFVETTRRLTAA